METDEIHIHVLKMDLDFPLPQTRFLVNRLPSQEIQQYRRFRLISRRREFVWSRLFLRGLLGSYLRMEMRDLSFSRQSRGKPYMEDSPLNFSLSHTDGLIVCSFATGEVGVDVEKEDTPPSRPWRLLAERFFSEAENDYLNSQPQELQYLAFLRIFTMKEAFGKAQGCGLVFPLDSFSVPLPLTEHSHRGNWEYFIRVSETNHFCLAHAVENPENIPWRYRIYGWDGKSFLAALKGQDSITEAQCDTSGRWS